MKERIGHYRIVSELGRGGMGVVYKAHEESLNRFVAIKVLGSHVAEDPAYVQRFVREAQSAARLNHPNIVQIYSISEDDGQPFFVMEYVTGTSLQQVIKTEGRMDTTEAETIVLQAAAGLEVAHEQGIIHRDIKPANLMIDSRGLVKIADFGLALPMGATAKLTATGMVMGSPGYLSPEQCMNTEVDHRTDIYSLGVTFFEALTGRIPFEADSPLALIRQIVDVEPPDVRELNPDVGDTTRKILHRMMAKDRDKRYPDCTEIMTDLKQDLSAQGESSRELPASAVAVTPPPPPGGDAVGIHSDPTVAVASGAAGAPATTDPVPAETAPEVGTVGTPPAPVQRRRLALVALVLLAVAAATLAGGAALLWKSGVLARFTERRDQRKTVQQQPSPAPAITPDDAVTEPPASVPTAAVGAVGDDKAYTSDRQGPSTDPEPVDTSPPVVRQPTAAVSRSAEARPDTVQQPPRHAPAPSGAAVVAVGESLLAGEVASYLEGTLARRGIEIVDATAVPSISRMLGSDQPVVRGALRNALRPYARHLVLARTEYLGERPLNYMGRSEVAFQARLTVAVVDLEDGRVLGQPFNGRVEYTHLNVERVVAEKLRRWLRETSEHVKPR